MAKKIDAGTTSKTKAKDLREREKKENRMHRKRE